MKHILLSAFLLLAAISTYGQTDGPPPEPCRLKLSQAPAVRGVKLGMTVDELLPLFPGITDTSGINRMLSAAEGYPHFGDASFSIGPSSWANTDRFAGISSYFVHTFDRRIIALGVQYEGFPTGARWKDPDDLIQRFSDSLHLPGPKDWAGGPTNPNRTLKCDGFEIQVSGGDQASIRFYTRSWEGTKTERLAAFEAQKRREFKP